MAFVVTVTGATGRLGEAVIPALEKIAGVSLRLLTRNKRKAKQLFPKKMVLQLDLETASVVDIQSAVRGSSVVVHLAGLVDIIAPRHRLFLINYEATRKLVRACEREKIKFFVHCSSIAVYADSNKVVSENGKLQPVTDYGQSKLAGEKCVAASALQWVVLRPGIIYGPHFKEGFVQVLEQMRRKRAVIIGSGNNRVPLVFERDVAKAFAKCIQLIKTREGKIFRQVFNIIGKSPTQREAYSELCRVFGLPFPKHTAPVKLAIALVKLHALYSQLIGRTPPFSPEYVELLARNRIYDASKAKKVLGFTATTPLYNGLKLIAREWGA